MAYRDVKNSSIFRVSLYAVSYFNVKHKVAKQKLSNDGYT